jgi:hypothetical protein
MNLDLQHFSYISIAMYEFHSHQINPDQKGWCFKPRYLVHSTNTVTAPLKYEYGENLMKSRCAHLESDHEVIIPSSKQLFILSS